MPVPPGLPAERPTSQAQVRPRPPRVLPTLQPSQLSSRWGGVSGAASYTGPNQTAIPSVLPTAHVSPFSCVPGGSSGVASHRFLACCQTLICRHCPALLGVSSGAASSVDPNESSPSRMFPNDLGGLGTPRGVLLLCCHLIHAPVAVSQLPSSCTVAVS